MKILVIFTGGTIGSTLQQDGFISTDCDKPYQLIEMYRSLQRPSVTFEFLEPYTLLSENLTGETLSLLGKCLAANIEKSYDGIIITHGSDTIQYTAAALSYFLPKLSLPVLLVCSQLILDHPLANGLANFTAAVDFIAAKAGTGIFVPYRNSDGKLSVHRGTRLLPHLPYQDDLYSIFQQPYGTIQADGTFTPNENYRCAPLPKAPEKPIANALSNGQTAVDSPAQNARISDGLQLPDKWNSCVLRIIPSPGMQYPALCQREPENHPVQTSFAASSRYPKAILLDTYHSGTLCSHTPGMEEFFETAAAKQIPVFLTGANAGPDYDSVKLWKKLHIITLPPASPIAMYMKLWMALCSRELLRDIPLTEIMMTPISEDMV